MSLSPFEYIKAINEKKEVAHLRDYNPYITNIALSHSIDTVMLANEMNRLHRHNLDLEKLAREIKEQQRKRSSD